MRSYLSLIPISAKAQRRKSRMTRVCMLFSVFLVTAIFSMADLGVRMELERLRAKHGTFSVAEAADSVMAQTLFATAAVLFVLILTAGVLMIAGSINSDVAQRTQFFGLMRCLGMSRKQIIRFVRLEALNWCRMAIPEGVLLGIVITWILCIILRLGVGEEFSALPLFGISGIGIAAGIAVGLLTVLLAARTPAKRAARVSPVTAASGNTEPGIRAGRRIKTRFLKIDITLGIAHAVSAKKNLILMTGSFALSIILFFGFSVLIDFVNCLMPQFSNAADLQIASGDGSNSVASGLLSQIDNMEGVKRAFGRRSCLDMKGELNQEGIIQTDLISYDAFDLDCLKKDDMLQKGSDLSRVYGDSCCALATWDGNSPVQIGDRVNVGGTEVEIVGLLKYDPFNSDGTTQGKITLIVSGRTFRRITGEEDYSLLMIQLEKNAADEDVEAIRHAAGEEVNFADRREESTAGTYRAFLFFVYGFLAVIALVTLLNIMNSISMSVSARIKQYGAMRAVGMNGHQITRMIAAEAFVYAICGCAAGCGIGLPLSRWLYGKLITAHFWYAAWSLPVGPLAVILGLVLAAAAAAAYAPAKRIRELSVADTVNEL